MAEYFILVFASLFAILDAFGNVPFFLAFLQRFPESVRKSIIRKAMAIAFATFVVFSAFGPLIFGFLRLEMFSFQIAGGILLALISLEMLFGKKTATEMSEREEEDANRKEDLAITPLAIPLTTGPGAITTGIVLFSQAQGAVLIGEFLLASALAFFLTYLILSRAGLVEKILGDIGVKVVMRIMGLLLLSLAVQFTLNGAKDALAFLFGAGA